MFFFSFGETEQIKNEVEKRGILKKIIGKQH